jgi:PiT family inorganic phosphate transporter
VGAVIGFAAVGVSMDAVHWGKVTGIVLSWIVTPIMAGIISFAVFSSIQKLILDTENPFKNALKYGPFYLFILGFVITMVTIKKGLKHVGLELNDLQGIVAAIAAGIIISLIGTVLIRRIKFVKKEDKKFGYSNVEKIFGVMMIFTASAMAFAHGSNDVANAVGPMAAVISIAKSGVVTGQAGVPAWVMLVGGIGIVVGLATYGYKVIATVGKKITELTPSRGFSAEIGAATTVVLATYTGAPISTTQTLVGAVLGVGMARGIAAIDLRVVGNIFMSWVITLPAGAILSILFFFMIKGMAS